MRRKLYPTAERMALAASPWGALEIAAAEVTFLGESWKLHTAQTPISEPVAVPLIKAKCMEPD
jgi:hypothetical protein